MGLQHTEIAPRSFLESLQSGHLGNPEVVDGLVARFLVDSEGDLYALADGRLAADEYQEHAWHRITEVAARFSGEHGEHPGIRGFHGVSLPAQLQAALGEFWATHRQAWDDDAVAVLFEWLLVKLAAAWKTADGDDAALHAMLGPDVAAARNLLLGVAQRA
jgi:hypothetical protein